MLQSAFEDMGRQLREEKLQQMKEQMETFKTSLEQFALNYKEQIRKNPVFRAQFHNMCSTIGVDPLASNKGVWTQLLGFGDFYYQIGVQVLEACLATRAVNGGLLDMESLLRLVQRRRGSAADPVSYDDLEQAIRKLSTLGGGVGIVKVGGRKMVQSVPRELNRDKDHVLELAEDSGFLSKASLMEVTKWTEARTRSVLEELLKEQLALLDLGDPGGTELYWFPCFRREE